MLIRSGGFDQYLLLALKNRPALQRIFFSAVLVLLVYYFFTRQLLFQLSGNPIFYQDLDPMYWLFMLSGVSGWLQSPAVIILDVLLFIAAAGALTWPGRSFLPGVFCLFYFIWFVLYNGIMGHHYAFLGVLFVSVPFAFQKGFGYMMMFVRFVFCFIYSTAGIWKLVRGTLFYPTQTRGALIQMNIDELASGSSSVRAQLLQWLAAHPVPAHSLWVVLIGLELFFVIGFCTLRFDRWIFLSYTLFVLGGWYLFGVWNYENGLFLLTLFPALLWVDKLSQKRPKIAS